MLRWLKAKIIPNRDFVEMSDEVATVTRYCVYGGKPYMLTLSHAPDCYVKKGPCSIATFETLSIKDGTLHIEHFAVDRNLQGSGLAEIVLRGFTQLVAEQTPEVNQITFDLYRSGAGSDIQKLAEARFSLLNRIGAREVSMRKPNTHCICVSGRWEKAQWTKRDVFARLV